ncbi:hypothetical protein HID58_053925 [Brassica napus]|uniref:F-box domain-containing protein n=2 Tax=Brassica TaxID=3705 RepID=A0ABQ8AG50_BRANA|nr:hypothetical protein HID58_053925 [Brassica napus]
MGHKHLANQAKKGLTSMADLPKDLVEEVFSRLPVTSLRGARSTCKNWNTLTKDESFFKNHIVEQASTELTVVMVIEFRVYLMSLILHDRPSITCQGKLSSLDNSDRSVTATVYCYASQKTSLASLSGIHTWAKPCGSSPEVLTLDWTAIGYVENSKSSCRKILRFVDPLGNEFVEYEIYDLSSNSWRVLDVTSDWHIDFYARGVSLKGNTYWFSLERYPAKPAVGEPFKLTSSASVSSSSTKSRDYRQINVAYKTKPMLKRVLDEYNLRYKTIVEANVHTAIIAIKGNPKLAEDAIVDAGLEASVCEGGFPKDQSPLTDLTQKMAKICDVTRAIVRMFL